MVLVRSSSKNLIGKCFFSLAAIVHTNWFQMKIKKVTTSPDIPLFKKLKDNLKNIDPTQRQCYGETVELFRTVSELENLLNFYRTELKNVMVRDDYRELIELSIVFLGGDAEKKN
ncbi:hypothetical protein AVEN_209751-1 [Araneus ventricosus]|uniref:Uncharacterized protein n=1 Tax=Araneus ventricosus TaxID=182803 RepID=A0A4Y2CCI7_ARAVE|nr:hypothetical protein AVEN_209751-1 [Araneus ventricosus]